VTVIVTLTSAILMYLIAFILGIGRLSRSRFIRTFTNIYVEFFRGTSLMVQLFWLYFVLPFFGIELPKFWTGVIALGLNYGAYGSEIVRSCIQAIPKGQTEAAIALNMTRWQRMRLVILPQAFAIMIPAFGNLSIELLKGTSLVALIALEDLTYQGLIMRTTSIKDTALIFTITLVFYFVLASIITYIVRSLERKAAVGRI
jgi:polar amino acid transport system permease protein